jgi:hypothetical protein
MFCGLNGATLSPRARAARAKPRDQQRLAHVRAGALDHHRAIDYAFHLILADPGGARLRRRPRRADRRRATAPSRSSPPTISASTTGRSSRALTIARDARRAHLHPCRKRRDHRRGPRAPPGRGSHKAAGPTPPPAPAKPRSRPSPACAASPSSARAPVMIFHVSTAEAAGRDPPPPAPAACPSGRRPAPTTCSRPRRCSTVPASRARNGCARRRNGRRPTRPRSGPRSPGATCRWCPPTTPPTASTRPASSSAGPDAPFPAIANGMPGLEVRLPLMFDAMVSHGRLGLVEIRRPHRHGPRPPLRPDHQGPYRPRLRRRPHALGPGEDRHLRR